MAYYQQTIEGADLEGAAQISFTHCATTARVHYDLASRQLVLRCACCDVVYAEFHIAARPAALDAPRRRKPFLRLLPAVRSDVLASALPKAGSEEP